MAWCTASSAWFNL